MSKSICITCDRERELIDEQCDECRTESFMIESSERWHEIYGIEED